MVSTCAPSPHDAAGVAPGETLPLVEADSKDFVKGFNGRFENRSEAKVSERAGPVKLPAGCAGCFGPKLGLNAGWQGAASKTGSAARVFEGDRPVKLPAPPAGCFGPL